MSDLKRYFKDYIKKEGNSFDTWGNEFRTKIFLLLKDHELIKVDRTHYMISYREGGGVGMGAYPNRVIVRKIDINKAVDVFKED
jgi:hypothetical protein